MKVKRPVLRWHGGKWMLAPWIIGNFPKHRVYVEPYGGAASVLLRKPRSYAEVYNDLDDLVVNLFRVLRSERSSELINSLKLTPFSRREFKEAYEISNDEVEEARRLIIRSFMGFGSDGFNRDVRTGFRSDSNKSGSTPAHDWRNYPESLVRTIERFSGVVIENRPALEVMADFDSSETLHYVDPPYLPETRSTKSRKSGEKYHAYRFEMSLEDHLALLKFLLGLKGAIILSGYPSLEYGRILQSWKRIDRKTYADGARPRIECLWLNQRAQANQASLFSHL
ncbi:MAG: DNA adenine methylase [Planctomycetota bacterium]|nr:DNA adenine methylase [Planctomycetota bacterium]